MIAHNPDKGCQLASSVIARPDIPGRIFVEVSSEKDARAVVNAVPNLLRHRLVRLLPVNERPRFLKYDDDGYKIGTWVRIEGPWKLYRGDVALIVAGKREGELALAAIPRVPAETDPSRPGRPPRKLLDKQQLAEMRLHGRTYRTRSIFKHRNNHYTAQGFLYASFSDAKVSRATEEVLPLLPELEIFRKCLLMPDTTYPDTARRIMQQSIKLHDRVKILRGVFVDLVGRVVDIDTYEVAVHFPSRHTQERFSRRELRLEFHIGDQILFMGTENRGKKAWVVGRTDGTVIASDSKTLHARILLVCIVYLLTRNIPGRSVAAQHPVLRASSDGRTAAPVADHAQRNV